MHFYQGQCQNCDFASAQTVGGVPALILDAPSGDPDTDPANPRLVLLDNESGRETILRNGHTFLSATLCGRYLRVRECFCMKCGHLYQQRSLAPAFAQFGWLVWGLLAVPFALLFFMLSPDLLSGILNSLFFGLIAAGATLALVDPLCQAYFRLRYPSRTREFQTGSGCPKCGSKSKAIPGLYQGRVPCPQCKKTTMTIEPVELVSTG